MMKEKIRKEILAKRDSLSEEEKLEKNTKIKNALYSLEEFRKAKSIMFYVSFNNEVDTREIIKELLEKKEKKVIVPYVLEGNKMLQVSKINDFNNLEPGTKGILEPKKEIVEGFDTESIDLVIVPGTAFDRKGNRIGFGYGYYDIFLEGSNAKKIALAYDVQLVENIETEDHDVPVEVVITDKEVILCNNHR
ncbi:5-formyltetrahydrofolate cyclo-ligase [Candidatus Woesearchaeota archaeon]|nr:5-formyltetrahydrofolate cyclo-ligase [Candidatus Woesearchaeota archaeon]